MKLFLQEFLYIRAKIIIVFISKSILPSVTLKEKKKQGFVLTISSKNNEKKVWEVMKKRGMILQKKY